MTLLRKAATTSQRAAVYNAHINGRTMKGGTIYEAEAMPYVRACSVP